MGTSEIRAGVEIGLQMVQIPVGYTLDPNSDPDPFSMA